MVQGSGDKSQGSGVGIFASLFECILGIYFILQIENCKLGKDDNGIQVSTKALTPGYPLGASPDQNSFGARRGEDLLELAILNFVIF